ncbi:zinc finger BED domain-containing protein RICESLEEPER 2 [Tanacetum coccineum]
MHPHCEALKTVLEAGQSSMSRDGSVFVYNPNTVREQFAGLVIQEGLPFNNFDNTIMKRVFQNHLQPKFIHLLIESIMVDLECFDDGFATKAKERFTGYFQGNTMTNSLNRLKDHSKKRARNDRLTSSEYERYLHSDFISHLRPDEFAGFDVLGFWKAKESMYPILSRMAWDMLSVQATSVASKSAFSTSGRVLSIRRKTLETCMCLKDHLEAQDRIQNTSSLEHSLNFEEDVLEAEVQDNEAIPLFDEESTR